MSGFEDKFDDKFLESLENPFEDPSITRATNSTTQSIREYNPFGDDNLGNIGGPATMQATQQAVVIPGTQQPPGYTRSAQQTETPSAINNPSMQELNRRQAELERKAAELAERERELINAQTNVRLNNWPPLPDGFCLKPCFYMDISMDIKVEFQEIVRRLYYLWIVLVGMLILNVFGTFCLLVKYGSFADFAVSIVYLILFTPSSFLCWYRPVYKAFRNDSSFQFMVFFFVFFFQFLMTTFMAVGVLNTGSCGIFKAISCIRLTGAGNVAVGTIVLIIALGFAAVAAIELFLLAAMLKIYRGTDASMQKAQAEFTSGILGNSIVRNAASDAAAATIRSQLNQPNNRY